MAARGSDGNTLLTAGGPSKLTPSMHDVRLYSSPRHVVGVARQLEPEVAVEDGIELRSEEAHLRRELCDLLADELRPDGGHED